MDPPTTVKFSRWKNVAHDVWPFIRAIEKKEEVPSNLWPDDYNNHLTEKPKTDYIGCKFCTEFG